MYDVQIEHSGIKLKLVDVSGKYNLSPRQSEDMSCLIAPPYILMVEIVFLLTLYMNVKSCSICIHIPYLHPYDISHAYFLDRWLIAIKAKVWLHDLVPSYTIFMPTFICKCCYQCALNVTGSHTVYRRS
jgi:hypothetical protein